MSGPNPNRQPVELTRTSLFWGFLLIYVLNPSDNACVTLTRKMLGLDRYCLRAEALLTLTVCLFKWIVLFQ